MIQILAFVPGVLFGILASLYGTVARIYDIMLSLTGYYKDGGLPDNYVITTSNVATTMYTLAGIFMLFRVTVSMINMLIEPDQINDRQAGAGKMLTRIVTSLLMLLLFVPNGWIFNKDPNNPGILMRIEKALLAEDGLIHNLMPQISGGKSNMESISKSNGIFIDNVSAVLPSDTGATTTGYDCYYVYITRSNAHQAQKSNVGNSDITPVSEKSITHVLYLTLYGDNKTGNNKLCGNKCDFSYNFDSTSPYDSYNKKLTWDRLKNGWPTQHNCPNRVNPTEDKAYDGYGNGASSWTDVTSQYVGGWHSLSAMQEDVQASGLPAASKNASKIAKLLGIDAENSFLYGVSDEAANFARGALSSFLQCTGSDDECDSLKAGALSSNEGNSNITDALNEDNPTITVDFMIGVVAGIGLVVWIALLCVDVIIRRFKLILLEMMAPIPIIAYSDPKDETFNKWGKMYISTYLDLFLKLIAVSFAILLLQQMDAAMEDTGLLRFFYIIAILVFAKLIPDMISNIFGIKLSSGTFKDITSMGKKVLGLPAGVAAKTAVGLGAGISAYRAWKNSDARDNMISNEFAKNKINALKEELKDPNLSYDQRKEKNKQLRLLRNDSRYKLTGDDAIVFTKTILSGSFGGLVKGASSGIQGKPFSNMDSVTTPVKGYVNDVTTRNDNIGPKEAFIEGIISKFRIAKPNDDANVQLDNIKGMQEVTKRLQEFGDSFESAVKKIPEISDIATLYSQGLITSREFKNVLSDVGKQMDANRNSDGTYNGNATIKIRAFNDKGESLIDLSKLKDQNGNYLAKQNDDGTFKDIEFSAGPYAKGVDTVEQKMQEFIDAINTNSGLAQALASQGLRLDIDSKGFKNVQDIKLSTFDVMRELDKDEIRITNSEEYRHNKALEERFYKDK